MAKGKDLKPHIGIFGRRNSGKSSIINLMVDQEVAIVSSEPGTTTDPVKKSMEITGIGPAVIVDTAGIDDQGKLGEKRIQKTFNVLKIIDCAILVISYNQFGSYEKNLIDRFTEFELPYLIVHNKSDLEPVSDATLKSISENSDVEVVDFTTIHNRLLPLLIAALKRIIPETVWQKPSLLAGLIDKGDLVLLVTPIDEAAPQGRMILPQVMTIRDVLDNEAICVVLKETHLEHYFNNQMPKPTLVITDSQVFDFVNKIIPPDMPLTSFSIMFARMKGDFEQYLAGTPKLSTLSDGDKVLILESCTHQVSCEDIGRQKLPQWIREFTGKDISFDVVPGLNDIPQLTQYQMVIQCGGCVVTRRQLLNRLKPAVDAQIAVSNYGLAIAYINGIFDRVTAPFRLNK
ncbi:MAG: [FeFe] hydrogenase H-cluster maturation GTPase HydF [Bacteroidales bacterium]|nr:[FeFe] hydrogenase H-cluster maturation GTPase HydF [Bacteroidales bacterium]